MLHGCPSMMLGADPFGPRSTHHHSEGQPPYRPTSGSRPITASKQEAMSSADHSHIAAPGILFALTSALLFGASTPFAKLLLGVLDPWMLAGLLYLGSGLGLGALWIGRYFIGSALAEAPLRRPD